MTGSFNPINEGEWDAIVTHDWATVQLLLKAAVNVHQHDHVGHMALHVTILVKAVDITKDLIDTSARITARLADGRILLHLAVQYDSPKLISKLLDRSKKNGKDLANEHEKVTPAEAPEWPSSQDDWSLHEDGDVVVSVFKGDKGDKEGENEAKEDDNRDHQPASKVKVRESESQPEQEDVLDNKNNGPDIININTHDWDFRFTALCYAVLFGSPPTLVTLLAAGADPKLPTNPSPLNSYLATTFHPLTLTIIHKDDIEACDVSESLIKVGATSTTADEAVHTIFNTADIQLSSQAMTCHVK